MKALENELLYGIQENKDFNSTNIIELYKTFKSVSFNTPFSEKPLIVIFNGELKNYNLKEKQIEKIKQNKNRNIFISPNIISINSEHNKSFAFSIYKQNNYKNLVKEYAEQILFFHELSHFYIINNVSYFKEFLKSGERDNDYQAITEESFSDLNSIATLIKLHNIEKEEEKKLFFKALTDYRNLYKNYKYLSYITLIIFENYYFSNLENINKLDYKELSNLIFDINKKILYGNYKKSLENILLEKQKHNVDIKEFFEILEKNNINNISYQDIENLFL